MGTINERIAQCIAVTGLTKTAFAQKINLSQPHMSKIALGHSTPTDRTIADICREFKVDETWLRTGEGEMFQKSKNTVVDQLAAECGLDDLGRQIMSAYLDLDENDRLAVGRLIQNIVDERMDAVATLNAVGDTSVPATTGQERTEADIAAKVADLERQNRDLAAKVAAIEEEDALIGITDASSKSPSVSVGNIRPAEKVKK